MVRRYQCTDAHCKRLESERRESVWVSVGRAYSQIWVSGRPLAEAVSGVQATLSVTLFFFN